ncbi:MAG: flagellar filament capping protein FliD [Lachnospiraceae bacterium]|nr:flagellar filament capping protein FliD [Lachnospiraceae bacterium]
MAGISGYDSSSISTLFAGLNNNSNSSSGLNGLFGISITDYNTIRSGSYSKLMKAYYSEGNSSSKTASSTSTSKDASKVLARVEDSAKNLKDSADALVTSGKKSVFNKVETKDADGNVTKDYDKDAIYKKVSEFVKNYNSLVESGGDASSTGILTSVSSMVRQSKINSGLLADIGITIDENNKLSIDEEEFKGADMTKVKSLFNGTGSYGYQVSAQASMANFHAEREAAKANTYSNKGLYTYNYSTGEIYNSYT